MMKFRWLLSTFASVNSLHIKAFPSRAWTFGTNGTRGRGAVVALMREVGMLVVDILREMMTV